MSISLFVGVAIAVLSVIGLSVYTGLHRKSIAKDVLSGTKTVQKPKGIVAGVVSGLIVGTFVGGSSTIGTAQLAYNFGMSAWWYTLGGGIACIFLVVFYMKPFRSGATTLVGMIDAEYGPTAGKAASLLNSLGTFISILAQLFSAAAVILVFLPNLGTVKTVIFAALLMIVYVVFGGTKGAGIVGILKLVLLYISMIICGGFALYKLGGVGNFFGALKTISNETGKNSGSLFCRGFGEDAGALLSLLLGVVTTQTYAQAIISARSDRSAKIGGLISAAIIPPIGILGILVGIYMRTVTNPATFNAKSALTSFIMEYSGMPDIFAGLSLGVLFISAVGSGAGIALGIALILDDEFFSKVKRLKYVSPRVRQNAEIILVFFVATVFACSPISDTILLFSFLSQGLRGCSIFAPLTFLLLAKGKVDGKYATASIVLGSLTAFALGTLNLFNIAKLPCDPVFPGIIIGFIVMFIGVYFTSKNKKLKT